MLKPDVELVNSDLCNVYYGGLVHYLVHEGEKWILRRPVGIDPEHTGDTVDDCLAWLQAQQAA